MIEDSYIGWINNISSRALQKTITVDGMINLSKAHPEFKNQKIESICVEALDNDVMTLHLVSDNDNGESKLFKVRLTL